MPIEFEFLGKKCTPPGGYKITVEKTGYTIKHYDYSAFKMAYESHCLANSVPLGPLWEEELCSRMCAENQPLWSSECKRTAKVRAPKKGNNFAALMSFLRMIHDWVKSFADGKPTFVEPTEAERRATICVTCAFNTKRVSFNCGSCSSSFISLLGKVLGKDLKTTQDEKLGSCGICQCALRAAVWVPLEPQQRALDEVTKETFRDPALSYCWKATGL